MCPVILLLLISVALIAICAKLASHRRLETEWRIYEVTKWDILRKEVPLVLRQYIETNIGLPQTGEQLRLHFEKDLSERTDFWKTQGFWWYPADPYLGKGSSISYLQTAATKCIFYSIGADRVDDKAELRVDLTKPFDPDVKGDMVVEIRWEKDKLICTGFEKDVVLDIGEVASATSELREATE